jgi:hypothetical protein
MNRVSSVMIRVLFALAFVLAGLAVWEKLTNLLGYKLTFLLGYTPSRLLELAVVALLFVIALQLRELNLITSGGRGAAES